MQRKKFLALMLTAALVGQPGAPVSIMAAETDESSDFGSFGSEASDTAEKKIAGDHGGPVGGDHYI